MKPLTDTEREIAALSATLSSIEELNCYDAIDEIDNTAVDCMSYNESYTCNGVRCSWGTYTEEVNFPVIQRVGNYDVWRIFQLEFRKRYVGSCPNTRWAEVAQIWFDKDGNKHTMRKKFRNTNREYWWYGSKMEFRKKPMPKLNDGSFMLDCVTFRIESFNEEYFRDNNRLFNQYNELFETDSSHYYKKDCSNREFIELCLSSKAETYFKQFNEFYLQSYGANDIEKVRRADRWFDSIKVANRHGYDWSADFLLWTDMLQFIEDYGGDTHNPQVICPTNLRSAHDMWYKRWLRNREKIQGQKMMEEAREHNGQYLQTHGAYLGIAFGSSLSNLKFHVIQSAEEMVLEGTEMHHCVGGYWKKSDSLIFSCTSQSGLREATIEVDLNKMSIVQTRGVSNAEPEHLDEINKTILENMNLIRMAKAAANKAKAKRATKQEQQALAV